MPAATIDTFVDGVLQSQLLEDAQCAEVRRLQESARDVRELALALLRRNWLTAYQINQILQCKGGDLTIGPFVLLERIGEGGMGQVFKARQKMLNRIVALKVIRKQCLGNPKVILRFQREIRAAGQLSHPHIVRAYDAAQVGGTYYIAMEFIDGVDLAKLVKDQGPLPVDQACEYIRQAALGLQHAFERGMVHRDIKPANLLVARAVAGDRRRSSGLIPRPLDLNLHKSSSALPRIGATQRYPWGVVKILDMGLARCTDPFTGQTSTHLTQIGSVMGTPEFIAPEQARDSHTSDIRADLYSLGCTLYFLLTGQPPFPNGTLTEKLLHHQLDEAEPVGQVRREKLLVRPGTAGPAPDNEEALHVPAQVESVLRRLLSKQPEQRFQTPIELASELQTLLHQLASGAVPKAAPARPAEPESVILLPASAQAEAAAPGNSTVVMAPVVQVSAKPAHPQRWAALVALALASLGGLAFVTLVTVVAVMLSRGNRTQASVVDPEPAPRTKEGDEPAWKRLLKAAVEKRAAWEEARLEMLRHRSSSLSAKEAKQIDELLRKMPTPLDALNRDKFDALLPSWLPADVVGLYGFAKANVVKPVTSVAVSPNGRWLVTNEDNGVRLFDMHGTVIPYKIQAHRKRVNQIALSADGRLLASASDDGTVGLWDAATRNRLLLFDKHHQPVTRIAFNHDGTLIASAGKDGMIRLWDPRTGGEARKFAGQVTDVSVLAFSPQGKEIFWGGAGKLMRWARVKDAAQGAFATRFPGQRVLAFQPHGNLVIVGGTQGLLQVLAWNGKTLAEKTTLKLHAQVNQAAFAPNGESFVTVGSDPSVRLWDARLLKVQKSWNSLRTPGHSAAFSPDGRHLVVGAGQNQVLVVRLGNYDINVLKAALE